jgi:hypothetical protein
MVHAMPTPTISRDNSNATAFLFSATAAFTIRTSNVASNAHGKSNQV